MNVVSSDYSSIRPEEVASCPRISGCISLYCHLFSSQRLIKIRYRYLMESLRPLHWTSSIKGVLSQYSHLLQTYSIEHLHIFVLTADDLVVSCSKKFWRRLFRSYYCLCLLRNERNFILNPEKRKQLTWSRNGLHTTESIYIIRQAYVSHMSLDMF